MILHCFPVDANLRTASLLGDIMFKVDKKHRERAMGNLRRSFPDMPESVCRDMARRSMRQLFIFFVEMLFDGSADHFPLHRESLHIAVCLIALQVEFAAWHSKLQKFAPLLDPNFSDAAIRINFALGCLLQVIAVLHEHLTALDASNHPVSYTHLDVYKRQPHGCS